MKEYQVNFMWDAEASVWVATSEDLPGLILESGSFDALVERVKFAAGELIEMAKQPVLPLRFRSERLDHAIVSNMSAVV